MEPIKAYEDNYIWLVTTNEGAIVIDPGESSQIIKLGGKPNIDNKDLKEIIKNLSRQLEQLNVSSVLQDKTKNIIKRIYP